MSNMAQKKGILERLAEGPVIGDGGMLFALEKRGYVKAGPWTPEATVEHPEAVRQLHREFLRAGSDVLQTFTFFASDDKLEKSGEGQKRVFSGAEINNAACEIARQVANQGDALVAGGLSQTETFVGGGSKKEVCEQFRKLTEVYVKNKTDFIICEYIAFIEEMEFAIEEALKSGQPVAATMSIGPMGDLAGVPVGECAVRMAKAGAKIVGLQCNFDYLTSLRTMVTMKAALKEAGLSPYLMMQPHGYHTPDVGESGFLETPEFPFAMEARVVSRLDMHQFAREAYKLGVRYIGGCCGTEPHHIRAMAEELSEERGGKYPAASDKKLEWGKGMAMSSRPWLHKRVGREYWENIKEGTGRPHASAFTRPDPEAKIWFNERQKNQK